MGASGEEAGTQAASHAGGDAATSVGNREYSWNGSVYQRAGNRGAARLSKSLTALRSPVRLVPDSHPGSLPGLPRGDRLVNQLVDFIQQSGPLFGVLGAIVTVLGLAFTIYKTGHNRHVRALRDQLRQRDREIADLKRTGHEE